MNEPVRQSHRDAWLVTDVALIVRLAVVAWAGRLFPPAGDGFYYDALARRIAHGDGYTWAWPDGAVTYAAHYPIGYPALIGAFYATYGDAPAVAMLFNAVAGAAATFAAHRLLVPATSRRLALLGALAVALHPALVPYTAALMTEGVTAALLCIAAALAQVARDRRDGWRWRTAAAMTMGVATLVRPQCLVLAPLLGLLMVPSIASLRARALCAVAVTTIAVACCTPWTGRNCLRMGRCALVSVNGGWNFLIGAQTTGGAWVPVEVPPACRDVWDEAAKDACFEREARARVTAAPGAWLARAPAKLAATFDYFGAAPWYLNLSNVSGFSAQKKAALGAVETIVSRLFLLGALVACARNPGPRRRARQVVAALGAVLLVTIHAWPVYLAVVALVLLLGVRALGRMPLLVPWTAGILATTAATHVVFFGAGRYGLVAAPLVTLLAFVGRGSPIPPVASVSLANSASQCSPSRDAASRS